MLRVLLLLYMCGMSSALNKCCPQHQQLKSMKECEPVPSTRTKSGDWWWFPSRAGNVTVEALAVADVRFDTRPQCREESMDIVGEKDMLVLLGDDGRFRLDVTKHSSIHDGTLTEDGTSGRPLLPTEVFCTDVLDTQVVALVCPCAHIPCVRKCCQDGHLYNETVGMCQKADKQDEDEGHGEWTPLLQDPSRDNKYYRLLAKDPQCTGNPFKIAADPANATHSSANHFLLLENGSMQVNMVDAPQPRDEFCGEFAPGGQELLMVCFPPQVGRPSRLELCIYAMLLLISALVLLASILIPCAVMHDSLKQVHSRCEATHSACLVAAYLALVFLQLAPETPDKVSCQATAFVIQWSFLAAFFWLNVMCIDISWAFSGLRHLQGSMRDRDRKKFLYYSLYAWGSPTIISIVTAVMEFSESIPDSFIKPDFGVRACWFKEKMATLAYFYGPMAALLLGNLLLFVFTSIKIFIVRRDTAILHENGRKDRQRFVLYAKLFLLMGVTWVTEIISWAVNSAQILWYVTDFINLLRAVFIFIIFCCKPKVLTMLRQRCHECMPCCCPNVVVKESKTTRTVSRKTSNATSATNRTDIFMTQVNVNKTRDQSSASTERY